MNSVFYTLLPHLRPSQGRYSSQNVSDKITKALKNQDTFMDPSTGRYQFKYDEGRSIYDITNAIPAIITCLGAILADGHHRALASLALGCSTIPINPVAHWEGDIDPQFWLWAEGQNYAYLYDIGGVRCFPPESLLLLKDDPLRYFSGISARKYNARGDDSFSSGALYPLWVKIGKDIPFIEMRIADVLYRSGFSYNYGDEKTQFDHLIEQARAIIRENPIPELKFLPEREHYLDSKLINQWLQERNPAL